MAEVTKRLTIEWKGETPHNTDIRFEYRCAVEEKMLEKAKWITVTPGTSFSLTRDSEFIQYRAILISPDGGSSPVLKEVILICE